MTRLTSMCAIMCFEYLGSRLAHTLGQSCSRPLAGANKETAFAAGTAALCAY
eukprot:SAG11_NODE_18498_length_489_cov_1.012821_1_plen_51_part_10